MKELSEAAALADVIMAFYGEKTAVCPLILHSGNEIQQRVFPSVLLTSMIIRG